MNKPDENDAYSRADLKLSDHFYEGPGKNQTNLYRLATIYNKAAASAASKDSFEKNRSETSQLYGIYQTNLNNPMIVPGYEQFAASKASKRLNVIVLECNSEEESKALLQKGNSMVCGDYLCYYSSQFAGVKCISLADIEKQKPPYKDDNIQQEALEGSAKNEIWVRKGNEISENVIELKYLLEAENDRSLILTKLDHSAGKFSFSDPENND